MNSLIPYKKQFWNDYTKESTPQTSCAGLEDSIVDIQSVSLQEEPIFCIEGSINEKKQTIIHAHTRRSFGVAIAYYQVL